MVATEVSAVCVDDADFGYRLYAETVVFTVVFFFGAGVPDGDGVDVDG
jgi:hypothetical protein